MYCENENVNINKVITQRETVMRFVHLKKPSTFKTHKRALKNNLEEKNMADNPVKIFPNKISAYAEN